MNARKSRASSAVAVLLGVGIVALGACRKPSEGPSRSDTETTSAETTSAGLSTKDQEFVRKTAQGGLLEVAMGRKVAERGSSPEVKAFAMRMVTDHGNANDELKQLSVKKGFAVPAALDGEHQKEVDELAKYQGAKLDKEYIDDMVDDHEHDVKEFREASKSVADPELRAWVIKTLPTLEGHLTLAKETKAKVKTER